MSSDLAISVCNISKVYHIYERPIDRLKQMLLHGKHIYRDEFWALQGISFDVKKGETVGIVGRNGSGKSTLLQIICGTVAPTYGTVDRYGRISALLELGSGFNPEFTGRENIYLNASIIGMTREQIDKRFDKIAAFADIGDFIDSPVKHYSSGMFARLAFSVAIHVDPEILIVDEILAVGDAFFQRRCINKFYEIRDNGCSILFVSHDQYQVKSICQRALYLEKGIQKMFGSAGRVIDQYTIDIEESIIRSTGQPIVQTEHTDYSSEDSPIFVNNKATGELTPEPSNEARSSPDHFFRITNVKLTDVDGNVLESVSTGQFLSLSFDYLSLVDSPPEKISFVFNLYRHDSLYICGTTTIMDGLNPYRSAKSGHVIVNFPNFPLLSGKYQWRVAINDPGGFITYAEAKNVAEFRVEDDFNAVGLVTLDRTWSHLPLL